MGRDSRGRNRLEARAAEVPGRDNGGRSRPVVRSVEARGRGSDGRNRPEVRVGAVRGTGNPDRIGVVHSFCGARRDRDDRDPFRDGRARATNRADRPGRGDC